MLFADDTNIFCSGVELQQLLEVITEEINKLKKWFDINKLSLNFNKTSFMLFGSHRSNVEVKLIVDNVNIERVNEIKFLSVILDNKLCWKPHIKYVHGKLARSIAVLGKTRHILNILNLKPGGKSSIVKKIELCYKITVYYSVL